MENFMNQQLWLNVRVFLFGTKNGKGQLNRLFYFCNFVAADGHNNNNRSSRVLSMRSARLTVSREGEKRKSIIIHGSPAGSARSADSKSVWRWSFCWRNVLVTFYSPEIQVSFHIGRDEKGMGGRGGGEERQKRQRNKKVYGFFLILPETGLLTPPVLGKIFITFFTFGSEGGPRPPFNPAVEKKTLTEKKELTTTKGGYIINHIKPISQCSVWPRWSK